MLHIERFYIKDGVYMAAFTVEGHPHHGAVWAQAGRLYVNTGAAVSHDLERHDLTPEQTAAFCRFAQAQAFR